LRIGATDKLPSCAATARCRERFFNNDEQSKLLARARTANEKKKNTKARARTPPCVAAAAERKKAANARLGRALDCVGLNSMHRGCLLRSRQIKQQS
jgi:hypothetical protein